MDFERNNSSIHQATFADNALNDQRLVSITRPENNTIPGPHVTANKRFSLGAEVGIVISSISIGVFLALMVIYTIRLRGRHKLARGSLKPAPARTRKLRKVFEGRLWVWINGRPTSDFPAEVEGNTQQPTEASTEGEITELASSSLIELQGKQVRIAVKTAQTKVANYWVYTSGAG